MILADADDTSVAEHVADSTGRALGQLPLAE